MAMLHNRRTSPGRHLHSIRIIILIKRNVLVFLNIISVQRAGFIRNSIASPPCTGFLDVINFHCSLMVTQIVFVLHFDFQAQTHCRQWCLQGYGFYF